MGVILRPSHTCLEAGLKLEKMLHFICKSLVQSSARYLALTRHISGSSHIISRNISNQGGNDVKSSSTPKSFDTKMLEFLACPLSKEPLRYDERSQELVNDSIGVAYKIVNGIPNLIPTDARRFTPKKL